MPGRRRCRRGCLQQVTVQDRHVRVSCRTVQVCCTLQELQRGGTLHLTLERDKLKVGTLAEGLADGFSTGVVNAAA